MATISNHEISTPAGTRVNTIVLAFTLISGLVVFLRIFTRLVLTKGAGFEDACIVFAMGLAIALAVTTSEQVMHGLGRHNSLLTAEESNILLKAFWAGLWIYNLALMVTKIAILVQYLRIFPVRRFRKACYAALSVVIGAGCWTVFSSVFICNPVAFFWDKDIPDGQCMNQLVVWFTNAGLNIAQDVFILFMPLPVINTLQIPKGQRTGLITMFALGASVTLVSVIRLSSLDSISNSTDLSFDNPAHASLSAVELNIGIICACLPAMRPLLALKMPTYFSDAQQYSSTRLPTRQGPIHMRKQSASTNANTTRTNTPSPATPLQHLRPVLSRTPSGKFSVVTPARPSAAHSRTGSGVSLASTAKNTHPQQPRFQTLNPLRMSPITFPPFSPPRGNTASPLAPGSYTRRPRHGDGNASSSTLPLTPGAKPLPVTPFPVLGT